MKNPEHSPNSAGRAWSRARIKQWAVRAAVAMAGLGLCGAIAIGLALALAWPSLPELHAMTDYRPRVPLRIYTADKVLIGEFGEEHRNVLRADEIPQVMKQAVLAAEDDGFYHHNGVDWAGMTRAVLANLVSMAKAQGGSTITMQVARNFYLSSEKTYSRKFYELLLTFKIESELTKDQILELYMNQIYLGHRAYGFAAASRTYFGKPLSEVTPAEAAMLAGIPKAPSRSNPITNFGRAQTRQHYVINRMQTLGYITAEQAQAARDEQISVRGSEGGPARGFAVHGEYPAELVRQLMYGVFQEEAYTRGINVYTTIDSKAQQDAYVAVRDNVLAYTRRAAYPGPEDQIDLPDGVENDPQAFDEIIDGVQDKAPDSGELYSGVVLSASPTEIKVARSAREILTIDDKKALAVVARALAPNAKDDLRIRRGSVVYVHKTGDTWEVINMPALQAALITLDPQDGGIRAMIGGFDFYRGSFNRVTQAWRQPGSNIKPFIYAAALERGLTPGTQISDQPFMLTAAQTGSRDWTPKNDGNQYEPMLTLREGLYRSKNMVSIRILQAITPQYGQDYLTRFGFEKERWPAVLPMALGAGAATPLQVANAYGVFANGGFRVTPYLINTVTDSAGKVLMQAEPVKAGDETHRAIDPRTAWLMNDILRDATTKGTGARASRTLKRTDIGGKTGTTNDAVDVWFSGFNQHMVTTVWMGFDRPRPLGSNEFGSGLALSAWLDFAQPYLKDKPQTPPPPRPQGLIAANGDLYFSEFPPGQAVAALDLSSGDQLTDFLNNMRPSDNAPTRVNPLPGQPAAPSGAGQPPQPMSVPGTGAAPNGGGPVSSTPMGGQAADGTPAAFPAIPVPRADGPAAQASPVSTTPVTTGGGLTARPL
ncbi:penicillin-binding protein 1A [Bordetella genomosp. 5]|uniref:Penicillin-binding protein 1A n=1 Tax=Bordetella genomosp. 5 TaxID=1395608 RepID=A0A261TE87_9BORD|nr:PBP1A family penicillin-binding protein [Bordetella genomosp. 5]OZI47929.1 penicillin-binding protein [Bordetella genomosp. 5]